MVGASLWRLALAGAAWFGFLSAMTGDFEGPLRWRNLDYFSQIGSLLVGITAAGALLSPLWKRRRASRRPDRRAPSCERP